MRSKTLAMALCAAAALISVQDARAAIVARDILITMDKADDKNAAQIGKVHEARIFYDDSKIDPVTKRVSILHQQHTPMLIPFHPDPAVMPVANAWLDLGAKPYTYHMAASPAVTPKADGTLPWPPYAILFNETDHRMTIRRQADGVLELSGPYVVSDTVLSGPDVDWVIHGSGPPKGMKPPPQH